MRQVVNYDKDDIIPLHTHTDVAHLDEAFREGYEGFHHNPLYGATGDAVSPGAAPSFSLFVLFETVDMAKDATILAMQHGRTKGWLANMTTLDAVPHIHTYANTKAVLSRMTLAEVNAMLADKKSSLLDSLQSSETVSKNELNPKTLSIYHVPQERYRYDQSSHSSVVVAEVKDVKASQTRSTLAQMLLKRRKSALHETSAGSGSGNEPPGKPPKLSGADKKRAQAQQLLLKKKADEAERKEFDSMLTKVDVSSSVEKRAIEIFDQKMLRFEQYEKQRKDEAATNLATEMMRESLANQSNAPAPPSEPAPNSQENGVGKSLHADFEQASQSEDDTAAGSSRDPSSQAQDLTSDAEENQEVDKHNTRGSSKKKQPPGTPTRKAQSRPKKTKVATAIEYIQHVPRSQNYSLASHHFHLSAQLITRWRKPAWANG